MVRWTGGAGGGFDGAGCCDPDHVPARDLGDDFDRRASGDDLEGPDRPRRNKVVLYDEPRSMVWRLDRRPLLAGERTYRLTPQSDGSTEFSLTEVFSGLLLPLAAKTFPDFGLMFERTAADLRAAATSAAG